jgi:hypothetical protein
LKDSGTSISRSGTAQFYSLISIKCGVSISVKCGVSICVFVHSTHVAFLCFFGTFALSCVYPAVIGSDKCGYMSVRNSALFFHSIASPGFCVSWVFCCLLTSPAKKLKKKMFHDDSPSSPSSISLNDGSCSKKVS